jgi:hypothetical protein
MNRLGIGNDSDHAGDIKYVGTFHGLNDGIVIDLKLIALLPFMASVVCRAMRGNRCILRDGDMLSGSNIGK